MKNQLGKLTNTPTLRWIFQCFQGVHFLRINQWPKVVDLTEERTLILEFGSAKKERIEENIG